MKEKANKAIEKSYNVGITGSASDKVKSKKEKDEMAWGDDKVKPPKQKANPEAKADKKKK